VPAWLTRSEARLAEKAIESGPTSVAELAATQLALGTVDRLISRGLLALSAFTPTDAAHVTGDFTGFDTEVAMLGAALMARQRNGLGEPLAADETEISKMTLVELHRRSALALMDAAMAHDGLGEAQASTNPLLAKTYSPDTPDKPLASVSMTLGTSLVALGASASTHYPNIAKLMDVDLAVPNHADVAGAVGAAAGSVRQRVMISITQPSEGKFRIHLPGGPSDMVVLEDALEKAREAASQLASDRAKNAGATNIDISLHEDIKMVPLSADRDLFMEALIHATAEGRAG